MLEIELKVMVESLDPVRRQLDKRHAEFSGKVHEHDVYYNAPDRDFAKTDEALRIRYTDDHAVVTYKGAKLHEYGLKAREEINIVVDSGRDFEQILDRLGFVKTAEVNKWRENYRLAKAAISLDAVDELGTFVEIELIAEKEPQSAAGQIRKIAEDLGVSGEPILASYLELLLAKRSKVQP
jgi:adenylate cyclase class 2